MNRTRAIRRSLAVFAMVIVALVLVLNNPDFYQTPADPPSVPSTEEDFLALTSLDKLEVKGRAPSTGYSREEFGDGWKDYFGCDVRNLILKRDLTNTIINTKCQVVSGVLLDPYTGKTIKFIRGESSSQEVQIDHVVALSDAWQKGAQQLSSDERISFSNDPLELLAVDGDTNQQKSNGDAATWLPPNRSFRCQYVARQIAVKIKYHLWITAAEKTAMSRVLSTCPGQRLPDGAGVSYPNV